MSVQSTVSIFFSTPCSNAFPYCCAIIKWLPYLQHIYLYRVLDLLVTYMSCGVLLLGIDRLERLRLDFSGVCLRNVVIILYYLFCSSGFYGKCIGVVFSVGYRLCSVPISMQMTQLPKLVQFLKFCILLARERFEIMLIILFPSFHTM